MFWFFLGGCQSDQKYNELSERISILEEQVAQHKEELQQCRREEKKEEVIPLCTLVQPNTYVVSRRKLETSLESASLRPKIYPHQYDGEIVGFRVAQVPEAWRSCGFENGDLLQVINGVQLRNPRVLSNLYDRKDHIEFLEVLRKRKQEETTLRITIQK